MSDKSYRIRNRTTSFSKAVARRRFTLIVPNLKTELDILRDVSERLDSAGSLPAGISDLKESANFVCGSTEMRLMLLRLSHL